MILANVVEDVIKQLASSHFKLSLIRPDGLAARVGAARIVWPLFI